MNTLYSTCPECGHENAQGEANQCPSCGLIYEKWLKHRFARAQIPSTPEPRVNLKGFMEDLWEYLVYPGEKNDSIVVAGRALLWVGFFFWGWSFIFMEIDTNEIGASFMHIVNLVFHEAGHVIFRPFGWFLTVAGGSLFQIIMPAIVCGAFLIKQRDTFAASIGLWWVGQSTMDLAPYIADARDLQLMLLGGGTGADMPGTHDWENILLYLGCIDSDKTIASFVDGVGATIMMVAMAWGLYVLWQQKKLSRN